MTFYRSWINILVNDRKKGHEIEKGDNKINLNIKDKRQKTNKMIPENGEIKEITF